MKIYREEHKKEVLWSETFEGLKVEIIQPTIEDEIKIKDFYCNDKVEEKKFTGMLLGISVFCRFNNEKYSPEGIMKKFDDEFINFLALKIGEVKAKTEEEQKKN